MTSKVAARHDHDQPAGRTHPIPRPATPRPAIPRPAGGCPIRPDDPRFHELTGAYALNALSDEERLAFERHLDVCDACPDETAELLATSAGLGAMLNEPPTDRLRERVLAEIEHTPQDAPVPDASNDAHSDVGDGGRPRSVPAWVAWVGAAAAGIAAIAVVVLGAELAETNQRLEETAAIQAQMEALLAAPDARTVVVSEADEGDVRLVISADRGQAMLIASDMEPAPHEHSYEAWAFHDGVAVAAGVFDADAQGRVATLLEGDFATAEALGVTIEPAGGSPEPTTEPVMVVPLTG